MDALLAILDTLRVLIQLRYMFAGLIVGSLLSQAYIKLVHGRTGFGTNDDALIIVTVSGAIIGLVFDVRRGLRNTDEPR